VKLTFLGTSAGKPTRERNVSALGLSLNQENKWYLFDCGEATQHQIMRSKLSLGKLDTIFITHLHGDHYYGLPGLLSTKMMEKALKPLSVYAPKGTRKFIECSLDISFEHLGYHLDIVEYQTEETFVFDNFTLKVLPLRHSIESHAFYIKENDISNKLNEEKLRAAGLEPSYLYGEIKKGKNIIFQGRRLESKLFMLEPIPGRSLIIAGDNSNPDTLGKYLDNLDLLVHECTYTQDVYDSLPKKILHTTSKDLGKTAEKRQVKNLIANHISPRYNKNSKVNVEMIYNEIKHNYKGRVFIANDLDVYTLSRDRIIRLEKTDKSYICSK